MSSAVQTCATALRAMGAASSHAFEIHLPMFTKPIACISSLNISFQHILSPVSRSAGPTSAEDPSAIWACRAARCAVAVARLGVPITIVGRVSDDDPGRQLKAELMTEGVDCAYLKVVPESDLDLTPEAVSSAEDLMRQAAVCLLPVETPLAALERAIELCRGSGVETIAAAEGFCANTMPSVFGRIDVLCCDEAAAGQLTGLSTAKSPLAVAAALAKRGCRSIVLWLGERGACVFSHDGESAVPGFALQPVDSTAAADAFIAALAAGRARGWSLHQAIRFANAAGALAGARPGLHSGPPVRSEVEDLLTRQL